MLNHTRSRKSGQLNTLLIGSLAGSVLGGYWLMRYLQPRHSPMILNGAVVVITGASSGIGRAYAEAMARSGARLVLVARHPDRLKEVRQAIAPYAADVWIIPADVTTDAGRAAVMDGSLSRFGQIDALINNAGRYIAGPLETSSTGALLDMITLNLGASVALTRLALPDMLTRGSGLIVNVASVASRIPTPSEAVYSATKHGLLGFSTALRRELSGTGVGVVTVMPGFVNTDMLSPKLISYARSMGLPVIEPELVADLTIKGLLKGQSEIYVAGFSYRFAMWIERHFPALASAAWRAVYTPQFIDALRSSSAERGRLS